MKNKLITITLLGLGIFFLSGISASAEYLIPGRIQDTGTLFEITDSEYLNVSLESSEEITALLESAPKTISLIIESSESADSTDLTISNLETKKTYYKYEDSYKNEVEFVASKKGKYTWTQDLTESHHVWFQEEQGTIFIPEDCSTYGTWDSGTSTCTLTQDLTESVEITANGTTLDCNNHSITGSESGLGINLIYKRDIVVEECNVTNFSEGIRLWGSHSNTLSNNMINSNVWDGIDLYGSDNNTISDNIIPDNFDGISLDLSDNNIISGNTTTLQSFHHVGIDLSRSHNNTLISNTLANNGYYGISLGFSSGNTLIDNNIVYSSLACLELRESSNNKVYHNNFINPTAVYIVGGTGNLFDNGYPVDFDPSIHGGNYFSDYIGVDLYSGPNQDQSGSDGIGDILYTFTGGQDNYPFMVESGWEGSPPVNQPPTFSNAGQYKSDGVTAISEGGTTTESTVAFKAIVSDPDNDTVKLQIELKEFNQEFNEQDIIESDFVNSGSEVVIARYELIEAQYHWRTRVVDDRGGISDWQEFEIPGNVDFVVSLSLSTKAAMLAKELVNSTYLYGGKGWDYNISEFVEPNTIKTGYNYWNNSLAIPSVDFGTGVDCSGLVMWSYNRSFNPQESRFNNFVKAEGADEQHLENTRPTTESQLQPGDVMFFDLDSNSFIDHVAMYVGESGGYDVVNARSRELGIRGMSKDILKELPGFVDFKQVILAPQLAILVSAHSPVDLVVTDPDGFTITPTTIINSDLEYLREIPGVLYYSEMERSADGNPIDQIYSYAEKIGDYLITVIPELDALPTDIYSLEVTVNGETTVLAEDIPISEIPEEPYVFESVEEEILASVKIEPETLNLTSKGVFTVFIQLPEEYDVKDIDVETIEFEGAEVIKSNIRGNDTLIVKFRREDLMEVLIGDEVEITVMGELIDETKFKGSDIIRIINRGKKK